MLWGAFRGREGALELCDLPVVLVKVRGHRLQPRHLPLVLGLLLTLKHLGAAWHRSASDIAPRRAQCDGNLDGILKGVGSLGACLPCDLQRDGKPHVIFWWSSDQML